MFGWATSHLEKLAQTVAPQPTDPPGRYVYACKHGDEQGAIALLAELPGVEYSVDTQKGQTPLHLACLHSMTNLTDQILSMLLQRQIDGLSVTDADGNTALHFAAKSKKPNALDIVKLLITKYGASVLAKNSQGQTAYDVASIPSVRQYLLPLQLQEETRIAINNGGVGLPPGMDLGGLKIANSHLPPPPMAATTGNFPTVGQQYATPTGGPEQPYQGSDLPPTSSVATVSSPYAPPPAVMTSLASPASGNVAPPGSSSTSVQAAPSSANRDYSLRGYSSAAIEIKTSDGRRVMKPDGFHSSSSDKRLQQKYGHQSGIRFANLPPPPRSGEQTTPPVSGPGSSGLSSGPPSSCGNPFAGGRQHLAGARPASRYVAVDPVTGQAQQTPPALGGMGLQAPHPTPVTSSYPTPTFSTFQPNQVTGSQQQVNSSAPVFQQPAAAPITQVTTSPSPAFPPPPQLMQASAPTSGLFSTPSPVRQPGQPELNQGFTSPQNATGPAPSTPSAPVISSQKISPAPKSGESPFLTASPTRATKMFSAPPEQAQSQFPVTEPLQDTQQTAISGTKSLEVKSAVSVDDAAAAAQTLFAVDNSSVASQTGQSSAANVSTSHSGVHIFNDPAPAEASPAPVPVVAHAEVAMSNKGSPFAQGSRDSSTASDLFSSPPSNVAGESEVTETKNAGNDEQVQAPPQSTEEEEPMDEIPLSPTKTATVLQDNGKGGLYQAIGMPPPPFSKK